MTDDQTQSRVGQFTPSGIYDMGACVARFSRRERILPQWFHIGAIAGGHAIFFTHRRKTSLLMSCGSLEVLTHKLALIVRAACAQRT